MKAFYTLILAFFINLSFGQNQISVDQNGFVNITGGTISLHNTNIQNDGQIKGTSSEIKVSGDQLIRFDGKGSYDLSSLSIDLSEKLYIDQDINIQETLLIESGIININSSILWLGEEKGNILGENNENYLIASSNGMVIKPFHFKSPLGFDPGKLGLELTSKEDLGSAQLIRTHDQMMLEGTQSVRRNYELITENSKSESLYLKAHYREQEVNSPLNDPTIWRVDPQGIQNLFSFGKGTNGLKGNYVEAEIKGPLSIFTIGESSLATDLSSTPTAFTPNGDGKNDVFVIPFLEQFSDARVMIFNRWGEKVYESDNYVLNPWDGKWKGRTLDPNTFYFKVKVSGQRKSIDGKISIVK